MSPRVHQSSHINTHKVNLTSCSGFAMMVNMLDSFHYWKFAPYVDSWENPTMLDAPVSGGVLAAESGTLTFMVRSVIFEIVFSFHLPVGALV